MPDRRRFFAATGLAALAPRLRADAPVADPPAFTPADIASGKVTARHAVETYLARIAAIDRAGPTLRSVLELNPDALTIADALDRERKTTGPRGLLHGVPVLLKGNIDTADRMATTAGSLALVGAKPAADAPLVVRLRKAGAVILGKTNLSEWANFRSSRSTSGWSGRGGLTLNPHALDRNPSGSSSGSAVAVAADLCAIAVGTETDGSIVSPANCCGIVGVKPTVGLVSRTGVIPISRSQDTAGPMARTVRDAALLLTALAGPDPADPDTADAAEHATDYTKALDPAGLKGARIGVVRCKFGFDPAVDKLAEDALTVLRKAGATLIDPVGGDDFCPVGGAEMTVLLYEFKAGLNEYLAGLGPTAPVKSLADVIAFNAANADREMPYFAQELFVRAEACGPLTDEKYLAALAKCRKTARTDGIDAVMAEHRLDALVAPTGGPAGKSNLKAGPERHVGGCSRPAAVAGYPHVTVPMGFVGPLPVGLSFFGRAWSEPTLLKLAFAFEQATHHRRPPCYLETTE